MKPADISRLKMMIADQLDVAINTVTDGATLDGLGCDSLDYVEIIMYAEDMLDIAIPDESCPPLLALTVGAFIEFVDVQMQQEAA